MKQVPGVFTSIVLLLGLPTVAFADMYKCTMADGKSTYQEMPCAVGSQKAIDDSSARARKKEEDANKAFEAERRTAQKDAEENKVKEQQLLEQAMATNKMMLEGCLEAKNCDGSDYSLALKDMPRSFVLKVLGKPSSEQNISGRIFHYFIVPSSVRSGASRLQVTYRGYSYRFPNSKLGASVEGVNIY